MLILYQFDSCPFCWKVKALLNHTKQMYETVEVSPFGMKELDFTDHKKVPVLKDQDQVITESANIVKYINDHYAKLPMNEQADEWVEWLDQKLVHYLPPLIHPNTARSYRHFAVIMKNSKSGWFKKQITRTMGSLVMPRVAEKMQRKHNIDNPEKEFLGAIDHWIKQGLNGKPFFGGNHADFVDCSVFGVLRSSDELGVIALAKQHSNEFSEWYKRCNSSMSTKSA